jgi:hypothetical protein
MNTRARKNAISVATFATVGSTLFGGAAFAGGNGCGDTENVGGPGGSGGDANANCLISIGISLGLLGQGGDVSQCNASGGAGGAGGTGADY